MQAEPLDTCWRVFIKGFERVCGKDQMPAWLENSQSLFQNLLFPFLFRYKFYSVVGEENPGKRVFGKGECCRVAYTKHAISAEKTCGALGLINHRYREVHANNPIPVLG